MVCPRGKTTSKVLLLVKKKKGIWAKIFRFLKKICFSVEPEQSTWSLEHLQKRGIKNAQKMPFKIRFLNFIYVFAVGYDTPNPSRVFFFY